MCPIMIIIIILFYLFIYFFFAFLWTDSGSDDSADFVLLKCTGSASSGFGPNSVSSVLGTVTY